MSAPDRPQRGDGEGPHAPQKSAGEQLGLLPVEADAARDALMPLPEAATSRTAPPGVGRPSGSRNRRTDLMAQYLVQRYGDPLEGHVALGMMDLRALVRELRTVGSECGMKLDLTVKDLLHLQADLRKEALPYIHAKRASEDAGGKAVDPPMIGIGTVVQGDLHVHGAPGGGSIEDEIEKMKIVEHQGDSDDAAE